LTIVHFAFGVHGVVLIYVGDCSIFPWMISWITTKGAHLTEAAGDPGQGLVVKNGGTSKSSSHTILVLKQPW
jgi:hypothetical protein